MPFDGTPKPDVFSLYGLIAWLETEPGETTYCFRDTEDCLAARYFKARGVKYNVVVGFPNGDPASQIEWLACKRPRTYAAALSRARALQGA